MKVLVTGCAGFIGMFVCLRLLARGDTVVGIDNMNDYYDVTLKEARLAQLTPSTNFRFERVDMADTAALLALFDEKFDAVCNLAAQAGVRYSLQNPHAYVQSNLLGFTNILEGCRHHHVKHLVYASSSSVYGGNTVVPFSEAHSVDHPVSFYAATKKANELMAHTYSHLYQLPTTGLRFFTVYGPWGRPDMSPILFARAIIEGRPLQVFNHGKMSRDFTYIDDIVEGVIRVIDQPAQPDENFDKAQPNPGSSWAPYRVYNIGNHEPVSLLEYIDTLADIIGKPAIKEFKPMQAGDVEATYADTQTLANTVGFSPNTPLKVGLSKFVDWVNSYYYRA